MNVADSEVVASVMQMDGYIMTDKLEEADAVFVNTCSIRDNAEQRVIQRLDYFNALKRKKKPNMIIGVPWTAKCIYPEEYQDIDMVSTTQEFYSEFYHFDLSDEQAKQMLLDSGLKESNL